MIDTNAMRAERQQEAVAALDVFLAAYRHEPDGALARPIPDDDLLTWGDLRAILALLATDRAAGVGDDRLRMFLEIMSAAGGEQDATDYRWNWINAFCSEHEGREPDTFNTANQRGFTTVSHDTDTDTGVVRLTDAGRAYLAASPPAPADASGEVLRSAIMAEVVEGGRWSLRFDFGKGDAACLSMREAADTIRKLIGAK